MAQQQHFCLQWAYSMKCGKICVCGSNHYHIYWVKLLIDSNIYTLIYHSKAILCTVLSSNREQCAVHLLIKSNPKFWNADVLAPTETDIPKFAKFTYILLQEHLAMQFYWLQTNLFSSQICFLGMSWWFEYQCEFC